MNTPVVVGVDGSATARKAAEVAHSLAAALNVPLLVTSAFDNDRVEERQSGADKFVLSAAGDAEKAAQDTVRALRSKGNGITVSHSVVRGKPAEALLKEATRVNAQLIVVGNRRMRGIGRLLGSVANSVAHSATCDVYIANTYEDAED
ncbi:universal stress protein UspA (plasmid) [Arthrobacter sp. ZXY-2]|uniref:universal stress protein n=1 Tax=Paenarthrobacter ureafaciens TaxID=37931 RepID=UPI0008A7040C|nr:universal stress protein UspA [Arthrobacter sp. ZXY-2]